MKGLLLLLLIAFCAEKIESSRKFFRGKYFERDAEAHQLSRSPFDTELWFDQILDHFEPTNTASWKQRYFLRDDFYKPGGPVFLMIGGEGAISAKWMNEGMWIQYARENGALCFQLEHRYYGKSHPTPSTTTAELKYLSSEQALSDLSNFIVAMNEKHNLTGKWISFGGSYPGSLSAWLREKYPHLVHGSISSSGPLLAKVDFQEYFNVVVASLETHSDSCVQAVQRGFQQIEMLLRHPVGQRGLTRIFKLCDPVENLINNPLDLSSLLENIASDFAGIVQYSGDPKSKFGILEACTYMLNESLGTPIDRLGAINSVLLEQESQKCLDYKYDNTIKDIQKTDWNDGPVAGGMRSWTYQTCTEFGFYQTSTNVTNIFGNRFDVEYFIKQCADIYGSGFSELSLNRSVAQTNIMYGALNPSTTNVLYVHGSLDPWHALGLYESQNPATPTILITGTAHCADMYEPRDIDLPQLKEARVKIAKYIKDLLK